MMGRTLVVWLVIAVADAFIIGLLEDRRARVFDGEVVAP